jgi:hypothetical protein
LNFREFSDHLCAQADAKQYDNYNNFHGKNSEIPTEIFNRGKPVFKEISAFCHQVSNRNKTPCTLKHLKDPQWVAYNFNIVSNLLNLNNGVGNSKLEVLDVDNVFIILLHLNPIEVVEEVVL